MTRAVRVVGATLGLLLLAAPLGRGPLRAQTPPPPCPPVNEGVEADGIRYERITPLQQPALVEATVDLGATFENVAGSFGPRDPVLERVDGRVIACEEGQVLPSVVEASVVNPDDENRPLPLRWSSEFATNGTYAIVFDAVGQRPNGPVANVRQSRQAVQHLTLAVPPKKPMNVNVSDPVNGVVTVSWEYVDPEPDLFGFEIRRARQGSGDYVTIKNGAVGPKLRAVSDTPPAGAWRYDVVAYRQGAPDGSISQDDTVEVPEPAPPADSAGGTGGTAGSGAGGTDGNGTSTTVGGSAPGSPSTPRASVDLQDFAASLNARLTSPTARIEPPDPGFQQTLPFDAPSELEVEEEPQELGGDEPSVGLGQRPIADPGERRRSLGFVAFGLLLFVLSLTGLFLKSEVKRADLLDLDAVDDLDRRPLDEAAPVVTAATAATPMPRRRRAPVVDPVGDAPVVATAPATRRAMRSAKAAAGASVPVVNGSRRGAGPDRAATTAAGARGPATKRAPSSGAAANGSATNGAATIGAATNGAAKHGVAKHGVEGARAAASRAAGGSTTPTSGRMRRPRVHAAPAASAPTTMTIPETRRRWSGRTSETVDATATATAHDFDDLVGAAPSAVRGRRQRAEEAPLDAPGLDVPDPPSRPNTKKKKKKAVATARR